MALANDTLVVIEHSRALDLVGERRELILVEKVLDQGEHAL